MVTFSPDGKRLRGAFKAILSHISSYRGRLFVISVLRSDSECAVMAVKDQIQNEGVEMELASKAKHVPAVEREIGVIKERCRGILHSLPYKLCDLLVIWLVYFVVTRVNQSMFRTVPGELPPFCNFKMRKFDASIDYRIGFV